MIAGEGIGPKVQLSLEELEMDQLFINSQHSYELVLANRGDIDAMFTIVPVTPESTFAGFFKFTPPDGIVTPGGYQAIAVAFKSSVLGTFRERFQVQIDGLPQKLEVTFRYPSHNISLDMFHMNSG